MSANPPIASLPTEHPDTAAHIHRYIASLPLRAADMLSALQPPIDPISSSSPHRQRPGSGSKEDGVILTKKAMREREERKRQKIVGVLPSDSGPYSTTTAMPPLDTTTGPGHRAREIISQAGECRTNAAGSTEHSYINHPDYIPPKLPERVIERKERGKGESKALVMEDDSLSETESAKRRLARKLRRRENAAIRKPKPPSPSASPALSVTSQISRRDAEGDHSTWSRELQSKGVNSRPAKERKKRSREMVPGFSGVVDFYNTQPDPPRTRLTVLPGLIDGKRAQGFLRKGKASAAVQPPEPPRQSHAFNEDAFLHPSTDVAALTDPDFDWRIKPHQRPPVSAMDANSGAGGEGPRSNPVYQLRNQAVQGASSIPRRLPSPGITCPTSWPSESQNSSRQAIQGDQVFTYSQSLPPTTMQRYSTRYEARSGIEGGSYRPILPHQSASESLPVQPEDTIRPHEMLSPARNPRRRNESSSVALRRIPPTSENSTGRHMAYGQVVPLGYQPESSPPRSMTEDYSDMFFRPFSTPYHRRPWQDSDQHQYTTPLNRLGTVPAKASPIVIRVSPVGPAQKRDSVTRESQLAPPRSSMRRQELPCISPVRLTPTKHSQGTSNAQRCITPIQLPRPWLFPPQSSSPLITDYSSLKSLKNERKHVYMDQDQFSQDYQYEQEAYNTQLDTILEQEVEEYGANSLEYKKLWQSRRNSF